MDELDYWKLKSKLAELELEKRTFQNAISDVNNRKDNILKDLGLNPTKNYRFNDEQFELVEIQ